MSDFQDDFERIQKERGTWANWLSTVIASKYQVSTCYRESSAMIQDCWYYETFIFELDKQNEKQLTGDATGVRNHFQVCEWIIKNGKWDQQLFDKEFNNDN